jgi:teichuronic acid biosynthesis glycosyltransferase TuaG
MNSLVSVIMPIFNAEKFLPKTLDSLLSQSYLEWELIAVDDCSKDSSAEILKEYSLKDPRIQFIQKESNSGSADTRNTAIRISKGRYIAFLDADDLWDSNFLSEMIGFMNYHNSAFSFSSYRIVDEEEIELTKPFTVSQKKYNRLDLLLYNRVGLLTAIYDTKAIGKMYFDVELKSLRDDYALWLDIIQKIGYGHGNPKILASYRVRKNAMTSNKKKVVKAHFNMLKNHTGLNFFSALFFTTTHSLKGLQKYIWNKL